jgi:HK97 family phage portal protein
MAGLFGAIARGIERRAVAFDDKWIAMLSGEGGWRAKSGAVVNAENALKCTTALACTMALSCGVAMLPMKLRRAVANGGSEEEPGHPLAQLILHGPNDWQTWLEWVETLMIHAVLCEGGYSFINRVRGRVAELIPILPGRVRAEQSADWRLSYRVTLTSGEEISVPQRDMFHLRGPSWNSYSGLDATKLAREAIGLALATEETHARLHSNGARPGGILSTDKPLGAETVNQLRDEWGRVQGGLGNAWKTAILQGGLKWQALAMSGVDNQHIETRRFQIEEICRALGVFPQMVMHADKTATFASAEAFFLAHVIHSLSRWTTRIEKRIGKDLLTRDEREAGLYVKFSLQALLRGDNKTRAEFYKALILLGVMTRNEARLLEDMNPLEGLDEPLVPVSNAQLGGAASGAETRLMREIETKVGRVLSAMNEARITTARDQLNEVLATLPAESGE